MADTEPAVVCEDGGGESSNVAVTVEGYEPTYEEAFPPLPAAPVDDQAHGKPTASTQSWSKLSVKPTKVTQVLYVDSTLFFGASFNMSSIMKISRHKVIFNALVYHTLTSIFLSPFVAHLS